MNDFTKQTDEIKKEVLDLHMLAIQIKYKVNKVTKIELLKKSNEIKEQLNNLIDSLIDNSL